MPMRVLFDANVILTYLTKREDPFGQAIDGLFQACTLDRLEGFVALHTLSIAWYVLRGIPSIHRRMKMTSMCGLLGLATTDMESVQKALGNSSFPDFEDNLQDCCAQTVGADYIVTANLKDYAHSVVPAVTPAELLALLQKSSGARYTRIRLLRRHWHALSTRTACRHIHTCWLPLAA